VFGAANQLYVPNDDSISGVAKMGENSLYVLCENSIQQIVHYPSNLTPFQAYTVVSDQGCSAPHSVVALSDRIYFYNVNYGFCEYRGGNSFPYGGIPISYPINSIVLSSNTKYCMSRIVGKYIPTRRQVIWNIAYGTYQYPDRFIIYDIDTGNWTIHNEEAYYLDVWKTGTTAPLTRVFFENDDGYVYAYEGNSRYFDVTGFTEFAFDMSRTEPVLDFGNPRRTDLITEIWFDIPVAVNVTITVQWRGGDTLGELSAASFATIGTISANSPSQPFISTSQSARLHQILWTASSMTDLQVNGITFKYQPGSER
jgi:hypothetical protein